MSREIVIHRNEMRGVRSASGVFKKLPHPTTETYIEDDYHCPFCGVSPVYVEPGDGDYYQGPSYICTGCDATFTLGSVYDTPLSKERATLIRAAVGTPLGVSTEGAAWAMEGGT